MPSPSRSVSSLILRLAVLVAVTTVSLACGRQAAAMEGSPQTTAVQPSDNRGTPPASNAELAAAIDRLLEEGWAVADVQAADAISDEVFLRRVFLDLAGRIPSTAEREDFLSDSREDRRLLLIDRLLASDDYAKRMADLFDVLLMGRGSGRTMRERHEHGWRQWLQTQFHDNRPWNQMAEAMLLARPATAADNAATWFLYERNNDHQQIAEAVAPAFFGFRIECAQCHDSMTAAEVEQAHYWGLVAFFNRGKNEMTNQGPRIVESAVGGFSEFADIEGTSSPNLLKFLDVDVVDEARPAADEEQQESDELYQAAFRDGEPRQPVFSRRERFVEDVLRDHPRVAQAMANRLWAVLMGRGLVHPYDEMDSAHTIEHPEILQLLTDDFRQHGYDIRRTLRAIASSQAYQRSSRKPAGVDDPATFAWYLERPLTAEQFTSSLRVALYGAGEMPRELTSAVRQTMPDVLPDESVTTIAEPLFLSNGPDLQALLQEVSEGDHPLAAMAALPSTHEAATALFLATLCRMPTAEEVEAVATFLSQSPQSAEISSNDAPPVAKQRLVHAAWAIVTSAEFRFNH